MGIIVRQSIKGTIVNYLGSFLGFLMTFFIMVRYLTPEEVGLTRILLDAALLFAGLASLGSNASIIRFYPYFKDEKKNDHGFFAWTLLFPLVGFMIMLFLFFLFKEHIINYFQKESPLFVQYSDFVIPLAFFLMYMAVFETNSNVLMRIVIPKFIREVVIRCLLIGVYLLYAFRLLNQFQFVFAFCCAYGIALMLNVFYLFSLGKVSLRPDMRFLDGKLVKNVLFYTLFLVVASLSGTLTPMLNTFFISGELGLGANGIFAVATYIATVVEIPYRSLGAITQPQISHAIKTGDTRQANTLSQKVAFHQLLVGSLIFFFIWINIDAIFSIIPNGEIYQAGKWAVFIIGMSRLLNSVFSVGSSILNFSNHYYFSLFFSFILTGSAIFLNLKLIPVLGISGAALSTLLSYILFFLFLLSFTYAKTKVTLFSKRQLWVFALVAVLLLCNFLWQGTLSPLFARWDLGKIPLLIVDRGLCSLLLAGIAVWIIYRWHFSEEIRSVMDKMLAKAPWHKKR